MEASGNTRNARFLAVLLGLIGGLFVLAGLVAVNPWLVARFGADGALSPSTLARVHRIQIGFVVLGALSLLGSGPARRRARSDRDLSRGCAQFLGGTAFFLSMVLLVEGLLAVPFPPAYLPSYSTEERLALLHDAVGYVLNPAYDDQYEINSAGFRGPPLRTGPGIDRVFCVGDSITFGFDLNDETAPYPVQLQEIVDAHGHPNVNVINAGVPGYSSLNALRFIETILLPMEPRAVILCVGWNDLYASLSEAWKPGRLLKGTQPPPDHTPLAMLRASTWLGRKLAERRQARVAEESRAPVLREPAAAPASAPADPAPVAPSAATLPHHGARDEFRRNLRQIKQVCDENRIFLLVLNMPTVLSRQGMTEEERRKAGAQTVVNLEVFGEIIGEVCAKEELHCLLDLFDLDETGKDEFFLDWCHLNRKGNRVAAERIFAALTEQAPELFEER